MSARKICFLTLVFFSLLFTACAKKKSVEEFKLTPLNDFIFDLTRYAVSGECEIDNPENFFLPETLKMVLTSHFFENQTSYIRIEKDFPQYRGLIEASGLYVSANDAGEWVDDSVLQAEEERIALELNDLDNLFSNLSLEEENRSEEIEKLLNDSIEQKIYSNKANGLAMLEYGTEFLIPHESSEYKILIKGDDKEITRYFYDSFYRLVKKELWEYKDGAVVLKDSEEFEFETEERKPSTRVLEENDIRERTQYDGKGNLVKSERYFIKDGKEYLIYRFTCEYDDDNQIKQEEKTDITYDDEYRKVIDSFTKKYIYSYHEDFDEDIPADFEYYEDSVLKMINKYSAEKGTYSSQIFFDQSLSVRTYYVGNKKTKDVYIMDGIIKRVKEYEQK